MIDIEATMPPEPDLVELERRLGVAFENRALLRQALIHKSLTNDLGESGIGSNERLEFLGDSVLGALVSEQLYREYPDRDEGQLTLLRSALVRASSLAAWGRQLDLGSFVMVGRGEMRAAGRDRDQLLSSAFEAVLGAVYIDRGFETARALVVRFLGSELLAVGERQVIDAKSRLQQVSQARYAVTPTYEVLNVAGAGHSPVFTVKVLAGGGVEATADGRSKQVAQQTAAAEALATMEALPPEPPLIEAESASVEGMLTAGNAELPAFEAGPLAHESTSEPALLSASEPSPVSDYVSAPAQPATPAS